jgi:Homeodomain-like domain
VRRRLPCSTPGVTRPTSRELPRPGRLTTARRKSLALDLLSQGHTLAHVRKVLGINRVTVYRWRQVDPSFAVAYTDAMEAGTDLIEDEARRRAVDGYDRPVFQGGKLVGVVRVYSDELAAMLLRGRRPEIYRETKSRGESTMTIMIHGGLPTEGAS